MAKELPTREDVISCLKQSDKAVHAGFIAKHFELTKASYRDLLGFLDELADEGILRREGPKRYRLEKRPGRARETWDGLLSVNPRGFGFVVAAGKSDVFIPAEALNGALHGDTVTVQQTGVNQRGTEGVILKVISRRSPRVAGMLHIKRKSAWLEPDDTRIRGPIVLHDVPEDAQDGFAAVVEITRFPESGHENPEGVIAVLLGKPGEATVEVAKIKAREQIEEEHPPSAMAEAERYATQSRRLTLGNRTDLRHVPFLTIDPVDARDHDDAVCVERTADGFKAYIAIADVSEYVQLGTALDEEALKRGCTIYLPDRAIPMLPGVLAADLCSLLPDQERYCMCAIAELDKDGKVLTFEVVEGLMRAVAMVSYESVARTMGFTEKPPLNPLAEAFKRDLKAIAALTTRLRQARMRRGALDLDLPEPKVELNPEGKPSGIHQRAHDPGVKKAYQMVEEMMLLANELVARWLGEKGAPAIYRVHGKPDEEKLGKLVAAAETLGVRADIDEMLEPKGVGKWLKLIDKHPRRTVLEGLLLRSLKQAAYDINNVGHFGLASDAYLHFTSPIRRYPDLLVHRAVKYLLRGARVDKSPDAIERLRIAATRSSARERSAMSVEREVVDLYRALYMQDHVGEMFEGTVVSFAPHGVFVNIDEPFVDVLIRFESLGKERFELSDNELFLVAPRSGDTIQLGDKLTLEIEEVSLLRRTVYGRRLGIAFTNYDEDEFLDDRILPPSRPAPRTFGKGDSFAKAGKGFGQSRGKTAASNDGKGGGLGLGDKASFRKGEGFGKSDSVAAAFANASRKGKASTRPRRAADEASNERSSRPGGRSKKAGRKKGEVKVNLPKPKPHNGAKSGAAKPKRKGK